MKTLSSRDAVDVWVEPGLMEQSSRRQSKHRLPHARRSRGIKRSKNAGPHERSFGELLQRELGAQRVVPSNRDQKPALSSEDEAAIQALNGFWA